MVAPSEKKGFLVCYDYGQGGRWAIVYAASREAVSSKFRHIEVIDNRPSWLNDEEYSRLKRIDIEDLGDSVWADLAKDMK